MLTKYAVVEKILEVKTSKERLPYEWNAEENSTLKRFAALDKGTEQDGYLYVRCRAISSRVNKNNDGWPSEELSKAYQSFVGRPVFVDHNNDDPKRTRGVIVDSKLHVEDPEKTASLDPYYASAPDNHKPPTWIELLIEVDGETFPKLADAIRKEHIDAVSMGANIKQSVCSVCANEATTPDEFCDHIKKKGLTFEVTSADGEKIRKKAYEDCMGIDFFEISFVFDPADETALISEKTGATKENSGLTLAPPGNKTCAQCGQLKVAPGPCKNCGYDETKGAPQGMPLASLVGQSLPLERVASLKKQAYPTAEMFVEPLNAQHDQAKDPNYIPQVDKITAPEEVNTLRNENLCPVCKASIMEVGRDDVLECPTCGHVQEPEPLNNPDLSISQERDLKQDQQETPVAPPEEGTAPQSAEEQITFTPSVARKQKNTEGVISEMFETILTTKSKEIVDKILPVAKVGRVEMTLGDRLPINNRTYKALKEADLLDIQVEYPAIDRKIKLAETAPIFNLFATEESAQILKVPMAEVSIVIEAKSQKDAEKAVEIINGTLSRTAATKSKNTILPADKKISDEPKSEKILSDQLAPVESAVTINIDTTSEDAEVVSAEPVEEAIETEAAETEDESSVEEVVAEVEEAESVEEEEDDKGEDKEARLLKAFKLADLSVEMGLVEPDNKMVFISELEEETLEELEAREKTLSAVKTAGLKKNSTRTTGIKRIPRLSHTRASISEDIALSVLDEQIFL